MAVKTTAEILDDLKSLVGDNHSDTALAFIENITDTLTDFEKRTKDSTNWEQRYNDNDAAWRQKYHDRFFSGPVEGEADPIIPDVEQPRGSNLKYSDLFKEG